MSAFLFEGRRILGSTRGPCPMLAGDTARQSLLPGVALCPTGGVNGDNAASYLRLGNVLAVGGSWVAPAQAIAAGDFAGITARARIAAALRT